MKTRMVLSSLGLAIGVAIVSTARNQTTGSIADAQQPPSPLPSAIASPLSTSSPMPMPSPMATTTMMARVSAKP